MLQLHRRVVVGRQPSDGQPLTFDKVPNYEDFGLGCFLLGGSEIARLAAP